MLNRYSRTRFTKKTSNCYLPTSGVRCSHYFRRVKSVNLYSIFSTESLCDFNLFLLLCSFLPPFFSWWKHEWTSCRVSFSLTERPLDLFTSTTLTTLSTSVVTRALHHAYKTLKTFVRERASYRSMIDDDNDDELLPVWWKVIKMKDKKKVRLKHSKLGKLF